MMNNEMMRAQEVGIEVEYEGKKYALTQEAYITGTPGNEYYTAEAICMGDGVDEYGEILTYTVKWDILEDYNPENEEEEYACDWESPKSVEIN